MLYKFRRLTTKIEKKFNISLFFLFPLRIILIIFENIFLRKSNGIPYIANYKLDQNKLKNLPGLAIAIVFNTVKGYELDLLHAVSDGA